jgi:hypothetical protein
LSKFGVSTGFTLVYTLAGEIFPTAMPLSHRFGAMISPIAMERKEVFYLIST